MADQVTMDLTPTAALTEASLNGSKKPTRLADAAGQFESLLIGEMLKSARESDGDGWLGGGGDNSSETAFGLAETQFAQAISSHGGFGLAKTIEHSLARADTEPSSVSAH